MILSMPLISVDPKELKEKGNILFQNGDYACAAAMFRRAISIFDEVSNSGAEQAAEYVTLEIACCCNLALACIKGGEMEEAEAMCNRALQRSPSCAKALFRRGQARLALGRLLEAATDFRKVADLEPTNIDVSRMLRCVEEEKNCRSITFSHTSAMGQREGNCDDDGKPSPRARLLIPDVDDSSSKNNNVRQSLSSPPRMELPYRSDCPTETDTVDEGETSRVRMIATRRGTKPSAITQGIDHSVEHAEVDPEHCAFPLTTTVDSSAFMIPGWLNSGERQSVDQKRRRGFNQDHVSSGDVSPVNLLTVTCDSAAAESVRNDSTVAPLVSKLKERRTSRSRHTPSRGKCTATQSEWLRLQTEENKKLHIMKERSALLSQNKKCTKGSRQRGRSQEHAYNESKTSPGIAAAGQVTRASEWEMLEKEETQLRSAFRAKLTIGDKKGKNAFSRLRTRVHS